MKEKTLSLTKNVYNKKKIQKRVQKNAMKDTVERKNTGRDGLQNAFHPAVVKAGFYSWK